MTFHMIFWDALDQNLSLGEAHADFVPAVGDNVTIFTASGATRGQVKARSWCVDDVGDAPPAHKAYSVNLTVKVQP